MMPSQKLGIEMPSSANVVEPWSIHERGRIAARMPAGVAIRRATRNAAPTSWSVTGRAPTISSSAGFLLTHEVPKFPRSTCWSHFAYCTGMGASSPISRRISTTAAGVASVPSMTAAGSPGMRRTMVKTRTERKRRTKKSWTRRATRYPYIEARPVWRGRPGESSAGAHGAGQPAMAGERQHATAGDDGGHRDGGAVVEAADQRPGDGRGDELERAVERGGA